MLAESNDTVVVESNHYFPREALAEARFVASATHTVCPWKGRADYLTVVVDGEEAVDAAWFYPDPSTRAAPLRGRVAFGGHGVVVTDRGAM